MSAKKPTRQKFDLTNLADVKAVAKRCPEAGIASPKLEEVEPVDARCQILMEGNIAPAGAWIHEYEVVRCYPSGTVATYQYAKRQATEPIFKRNPKKRGRSLKQGKDPEFSCHQHIGRVKHDWIRH